jgi:hypothetical protein
VWRDVWLRDEQPAGARVIVYRKGCSRPFVGTATYRSYVQTDKGGEPNQQWQRGPDYMLAKCAEALALRKAFPSELGGTITPEEEGTDDDRAALAPLPAPPARSAQSRDAHVDPATESEATSTSPSKKSEPETKPPNLTDKDIEVLTVQMRSAKDQRELAKIGERIGGYPLSKEQRDGLLKTFSACRDELRDGASK